MANYKVKYALRNRLARSLQAEIQKQGLIDYGTLYDSIRISAVKSDRLNELSITINAMYYYLFLDAGTVRGIEPHFITQYWLDRPDTRAVLNEIIADFIKWQVKEYPLLDVAKILSNPKVTIDFNWIEDPYAGLPTSPTYNLRI